MRGVVRATKGDYVLIETEAGEFTVARLTGGRVDLHDGVDGDLESPGEAALELDAGGQLDVYVHDSGCPMAVATARVRRLSR